ncbi:hypothetical protein R3P38DRAFT_2803410 [Favolaschia claudopus]|uniref:Uncharacterized protein n=1 Tax=Favolaschia claudopus TaxID=2862362 RepID=A0AAV9ZU23_9AGAR
MDFAARFSKDGFDLMRSNGGKYPGLSKEVDRSLGDVSDSAGTEPSISAVTNDSLVLAYNAELALKSEKAAHVESEGHSVWINLSEDGQKKAHKKTILRTLMDPTFDINDGKSHDRLLRVRYFSIGGDSWDRSASTVYSKSTADDHLLKIQGLFAALCTGIKIVNTHPITYLEAAPRQILSLAPFDESHNSSGRISWVCITQYVAFESAKAKQSSSADVPSRMRHLSVTLDGRLVLPLKSSDLRQLTLEEILNIPRPADKESEKTWVFSSWKLYSAVKDGRYPYEATVQDATTQTTEKISHCFASIVAPAPKDARRPCPVCLKNVAGPDRQNHMGRHIFLSQRGVAEPENVTQVAKDYPCGFCGKQMSEKGCDIGIASGRKASSSCAEAYPFQINAALKSSITKPSTNCTETHWKYNMPQHPSWKDSLEQPDWNVLSSAISISQDEESRMKIPDSQRGNTSQTLKRGLEDHTLTPSRTRVTKSARSGAAATSKQQVVDNSGVGMAVDVFA